jgi:8-oxo-dGTP pyrophosphatase MutT (NUDIX family)
MGGSTANARFSLSTNLGLKLPTLPGGKVKRGESLVKALKRELYEETGLEAQIGSPSAKYFRSARRGPVKKISKIRAATHQFTPTV